MNLKINELNYNYKFSFDIFNYSKIHKMQKDLTQAPNGQSQPQKKEQITNPKDIQKKLKLIEQMKRETKDGKDRRKIKYYQDLLKKHNYWDSRPMLRDDKDQIDYGNIEGERKVEDVNKQPEKLPEETLYWCEVDVKNDHQLNQMYELLTNNYVEDDDNTFRFDYSREFLRWALSPPGYQPKWLVGIRNEKKELVGCITGVPVTTCVENDKIKMAEINYLCVHKGYRQKNLTPILISQVTRRVNLKGKWQAIYTAGRNLPTPFCRATYYHRSLNPKKLIEVKFSGLGPNQTLAMVKKLYALPEQPTIKLRPMNKKDVFGVYQLVNDGLSKFVVKFHYTEQQIRHYFLPQQKIIYTYVVEHFEEVQGKKKSKITDVLSFYSLPSHVIGNPKHNMLYACYSFYNFATSVPFEQLIRNALIMAKKEGFDVYNCLNLMDNATVFNQLHFQVGDGNLNYYLYNWIMKCKKIQPPELGIVLF